VSKLCVCGKGGSGKSTAVALLADELGRRGKQVLEIMDAGLTGQKPTWNESANEIALLLEGTVILHFRERRHDGKQQSPSSDG